MTVGFVAADCKLMQKTVTTVNFHGFYCKKMVALKTLVNLESQMSIVAGPSMALPKEFKLRDRLSTFDNQIT
jgi:hypothetical protein